MISELSSFKQICYALLDKIFNGKIIKSVDLKEYQKAQESYRQAILFLGDEKFSPSWRTLLNVAILRARVCQQEVVESPESLAQSFSANKNRGFAGWIAQYIAEILLHQDPEDFSEAGIWARKALNLHRENGMNLLLGRDYLLHAELDKRRKDFEAARKHLTQAMAIFQECEAGGYLQKAKKDWIEITALDLDR